MPKQDFMHVNVSTLIESNLGRLLHITSVLVKRTVRIVCLLLYSRTEFEQVFGYWLVGSLQYVDQSTSESLFVLSEHSDGNTGLAGTTCSTNPMDVVLNLMRCQSVTTTAIMRANLQSEGRSR